MCASRVIGGAYTKLGALMGDPQANLGDKMGLQTSIEGVLAAPTAPVPGGMNR